MKKINFLLLIVGLCAAIIFGMYKTSETLTAALLRMNVSGSVYVGSKIFRMDHGILFAPDGHIDALTKIRVLKLLYLQANAARDPILGIAGNNPDLIEQSVSTITSELNTLGTQDTSGTIQSLYPVTYLLKLADLERTRHTLIIIGTQKSADAYIQALHAAAVAGKADSNSFSAASMSALGTSTFSLVGANGIITDTTFKQSAMNVTSQMNQILIQIKELESCESYPIGTQCDDFLRNDLGTGVADPVLSDAMRIQAEDIQSIILEARANGETANKPLFILPNSVCMRVIPAPYVFRNIQSGAVVPVRIQLLNNLFFTSTDRPNAPILSALNKDGISYSKVEPETFYSCPDVRDDIARITAMNSTIEFARAHPDLASFSRARLLGDMVYESDVFAYISNVSAEADQLSDNDRIVFNELSLMFRTHSGGLDILTQQIASILQSDILLSQKGFSFDLSAKGLFMTHSAFTSLFLVNTSLLKTSHLASVTATSSDKFLSSIKTYSLLKTTVPRTEIVHDLRGFSQFEGTLPQ